MRIGYAYWGFLGDNKLDADGKELSTPDGNATYSWSIIHEAQKRGHEVHFMQQDRDRPAIVKFRHENFAAFSKEKRYNAYMNCRWSSETFPQLDILLLEWRWPIDGKNCDIQDGRAFYVPEKHSCDLARQLSLLSHYKGTKTRIVIWDLDHKLTKENELEWEPDAIFETSSRPLELHKRRTRVEPPICTEDLLQMPLVPQDPNRKLVYIGSRYERDDVIDEFIKPVSDRFPGQVEFWGKWEGDCKERWPNISFNGRITTKDFYRVYSSAVACPLLAKRSYLKSGFITPRPWEALMFGTLPIGLKDFPAGPNDWGSTAGAHKPPLEGIDQYCLWSANTAVELGDRVEGLSNISLAEKHEYREMLVDRIRFMDVKYFVDEIEKVL